MIKRKTGPAIRTGTIAVLLAWMIAALPASARAQGGAYVNFETIPTRALALSPDGTRLFAANTPDGRLEVFSVTRSGLTPTGSVTVGLDPVSIAVRNAGEVWVVNLLSDSVSVVDVSGAQPRVVRTLLVGDEPRDVVFAGPDRRRAFITAARRGQNHPGDIQAELQRTGVGRADVWVFDADNLGAGLGGTPLAIVQLFADKPGAMAVSPDGRQVLVAIATSGNRTTAIAGSAVCGADGKSLSVSVQNIFANDTVASRQNDGPCALANGGMSPGGVPAPNQSTADGATNPRTGVIVKFDSATGGWLDGLRRDWRDAVPFALPDNDVFVIDAMASPPAQVRAFQNVGTLNKSIAIDPSSGRAYVASIEAINTNRFLSIPRVGAFPNPTPAPGVARTADPVTGKTLNGHLYESRISILSGDGRVVTRHLNKHIDYEVVPSPPGVKERSVADPQGLAFSPDGSTLFVAGLGSNKVVPFVRSALDDDSFVPDASTHIQLSGNGGPSDIVLSDDGARMFVYKRFDNAVATIDLRTRTETSVAPLPTPEPDAVRLGRKFFYDAVLTSSNGEANCNVCHPAADKDDLPWDLGTPFLPRAPNTNSFIQGVTFPIGSLSGGLLRQLGNLLMFNPLKGPMTVLTLRGLKDGGPMFWRGEATSATPLDERANFQNFNVVFEALLGREQPLAQPDFDRLTDWVLTVVPPPNPHRSLDNRLNPSQEEGRAVYFGERGPVDGPLSCNDCHVIDPSQGFFGTRGEFSIEGESQLFKVQGLRLVYDKVGSAGATSGKLGDPRVDGGARTRTGPQIRGSGTIHDGSSASLEEFIGVPVFDLDADQVRQVTDFVSAFPTNLAPVVGQQITLNAASGEGVGARIDLLQARAAAPFVLVGSRQDFECDLVAKAVIEGRERGFLFEPSSGMFLDDQGGRMASEALRALARSPGQAVTFTCIYPGGGERFGLDRDQDGLLDGVDAPNPTGSGGGFGLAFLAALVDLLELLAALLSALTGAVGM